MIIKIHPLGVLALAALFACGPEEGLIDATEAPGIQAGVVITADDATVSKHFVSTEGGAPTALEALEETEVPLTTLSSPLGTAICAISGVGQPADDCFGDPEGEFWAFFLRNPDGSWTFSDVGVDGYSVRDGDVLAFVWTASDEDFNPIRTPPAVAPEDFSN